MNELLTMRRETCWIIVFSSLPIVDFGALRKYPVQDVTTIQWGRLAVLIRYHINKIDNMFLKL